MSLEECHWGIRGHITEAFGAYTTGGAQDDKKINKDLTDAATVADLTVCADPSQFSSLVHPRCHS